MSAASNKFIYKDHIWLLLTYVTKQYWTSENISYKNDQQDATV